LQTDAKRVSDQETDQLTHRIFLLTILAKALLGVVQLATAAALMLGVTQKLPAIIEWIFRAELAEDPKDFVASQIISWAGIIPASDLTFYTVYFAAHGGLHIAIVAALLYGSRWAYHGAIVVLSAFVVYQLFEWFSVGGKMLIILSVIDLAVIYLTVREERRKDKMALLSDVVNK